MVLMILMYMICNNICSWLYAINGMYLYDIGYVCDKGNALSEQG